MDGTQQNVCVYICRVPKNKSLTHGCEIKYEIN